MLNSTPAIQTEMPEGILGILIKQTNNLRSVLFLVKKKQNWYVLEEATLPDLAMP